jgi:hypothetical protein
MRTKLDEFRNVLASTNPPVLDSLRPGLFRTQVETGLANLPFRISSDAIELYTWADAAPDELFEILPGAYLIPFDRALSEFREIHPMHRAFDAIFPQRYRDCFRFLGDLSDGGFAFGRIDSPSKGSIVGLCIHAEWRLAFASLEKLIDTAIECYREGVFASSDMPDFDKYYEIGRRSNPDMEYWSQETAES